MSSKQFVYKDNYYINTASEGTMLQRRRLTLILWSTNLLMTASTP